MTQEEEGQRGAGRAVTGPRLGQLLVSGQIVWRLLMFSRDSVRLLGSDVTWWATQMTTSDWRWGPGRLGERGLAHPWAEGSQGEAWTWERGETLAQKSGAAEMLLPQWSGALMLSGNYGNKQ